MHKHLYTSLINSGAVTVFTSLAMTKINKGNIVFLTWMPNWLVSWSIVFVYVFVVAPRVAKFISNRMDHL